MNARPLCSLGKACGRSTRPWAPGSPLRSVQTTRCAVLRLLGASSRSLRWSASIAAISALVAPAPRWAWAARCRPFKTWPRSTSTAAHRLRPRAASLAAPARAQAALRVLEVARSPRAYRRARTGHSAVVSRAAPTSRRRPAKPRLSACQRRGSAVCKDVGHKSRTCKFGPGKGSSPSCPAPARRGALTRYVILTGDALPADSNDANALDVI